MTNMLGKVPTWSFGRNASFGLAVNPRKDAKIYIKLFKGVIFSRKVTFLWKDVGAATPPSEDGEAVKEKVELEFKQKIQPKIVVVPTSGALIHFSEFPIVLFASDSTIVYSNDELSSFKAFEAIEDGEIYSKDTGQPGSAHELPVPDDNEYDDAEDTLEDTKRGLLVPLLRIAVDKDAEGVVFVSEILNIVQNDTFAITEAEATEEGEGEDGDPCARDGEIGASNGYTGGVPEMPDEEPGESDPEDGTGEGVDPCPTDETDDE